MKIKKLFAITSILLFILACLFSGCKEKIQCRCNCETCCCAPSDHLFSFPKQYLMNIHITSGSQTVVIDGERAEEFIDVLNSFVPTSSEEWIQGYSGGYWTLINFYDSVRKFAFTESSVSIQDTTYTGEDGSLSRLVETLEEAAAQSEPAEAQP